MAERPAKVRRFSRKVAGKAAMFARFSKLQREQERKAQTRSDRAERAGLVRS